MAASPLAAALARIAAGAPDVSLASAGEDDAPVGPEGATALAAALEGCTTVERLEIASGELGPDGAETLAEALAASASLHTLRLYCSGIGTKGAAAIARLLAASSTLQDLDIWGNDIGSAGAASLGVALETNHSLLSLDLQGNEIDAHGLRSFANSLAQNHGLKTLNLSNNFIDAVGTAALGKALTTNQTLRSLKLWGCGIGPDGAANLANALKENSSIIHLYLSNNAIGPRGARAIGAALEFTHGLETLVLQNNAMACEGACALGKGLKNNRTLVTLDVSSNGIGVEGAVCIGVALEANSALQFLDVSTNPFGILGGRALATALGTNSTLVDLEAMSCDLGAEGSMAIAVALESNHTLTSINLSWNELGDGGATAISRALLKNASLRKLNLSRNEIHGEGVKTLGKMLRKNKALQTLDLSFNELGPEGAAAVGRGLRTNTGLRELNLADNELGPSGAELLRRNIVKNSTLLVLLLDFNNLEEETELAVGRSVDQFRQRCEEAFFSAVQGTAAWRRVKLMVVGRDAAGKTSTVRSLLGHQPLQVHVPTIGASLKVTTVSDWLERAVDGSDFDHLAARAAASRLIPPAVRRKPGARDKQKFAGLFRRLYMSTSQVGGRLSATSLMPPDASMVRVKEADASERFNMDAITSMALQDQQEDQVSLSIWDYGGQEVYYGLHHVLLSNEGMFLVVFSMQEVLDAAKKTEAMRFLRSWLEVARLHARLAPIILVGTHADKVPSRKGRSQVHDVLVTEFDTLLGNVKRNGALCYFPINNLDETLDRAGELREAISSTAASLASAQQQIPLAWSLALERLMERGVNYMLLDDVASYVADEFGMTLEGTRAMLERFHKLGVLVHLRATEHLEQLVVLRPQWLIDQLAKLIADPETAAASVEPVLGVDQVQLDRLHRTGIATRDYLAALWGDAEMQYLVDFMVETMLAAEFNTGGGGSQHPPCYLVGSVVTQGNNSAEEAFASFSAELVAGIHFPQYLPDGTFQRLVCACVMAAGAGSNEAPVVGPCNAILWMGSSTQIALVEERANQRIVIKVARGAVDGAPHALKVVFGLFMAQRQVVMPSVPWEAIVFPIAPPGEPTDTSFPVRYHDLLQAKLRGKRKVQRASLNRKWAMLEHFDTFFVDYASIGPLDSTALGPDVVTVVDDHFKSRAAAPRQIYVCHNPSSGAEMAAALTRELQSLGFAALYDNDLQGAADEDAMYDDVAESSCFCLVISHGVFASRAVRTELQAAMDLEIPILVVYEEQSSSAAFVDLSDAADTAPRFIRGLFDVAQRERFIPFRRRFFDKQVMTRRLALQICVSPPLPRAAGRARPLSIVSDRHPGFDSDEEPDASDSLAPSHDVDDSLAPNDQVAVAQAEEIDSADDKESILVADYATPRRRDESMCGNAVRSEDRNGSDWFA